MNKDFKCDKCGELLAVDEVGYMGNPDKEDESCDFLTDIITLCVRCNE
jgi:hypothetical protein